MTTAEDIQLKECIGDRIAMLDKAEPYVWRMCLSADDFVQLELAIENSVKSHGGDASHLLTGEYAMHVIVYLAEWYKRRYQSGNTAQKAIELNSVQLEKLWNASGIDIKKYVYHTAAGNRLWQYSIYVLGGLAMKHELGKTDDRFLKILCRMLHGENYQLEDIDEEARAIAFRSSIKEGHSLHYFLAEIVNNRVPYHASDVAMAEMDASRLMMRIRHANDEVLKNKFRLEWVVNYASGYSKLYRKLRLWLNPEFAGGELHHYLRYDRIRFWKFDNPHKIQRLFVGLRFVANGEIVEEANFERPIISYINTGEEASGFVSQGVNRYGTCVDLPSKVFDIVEIWVKDNEGRERMVQTEKVPEYRQLWRVSEYGDEWSSQKSAQKETAVVFSHGCRLMIDAANESIVRLPFYNKKFGNSDEWGWYYICDRVEIEDSKGARETLFNQQGYYQIYTRLYKNIIHYDEAGRIKYFVESEDEDFDVAEERMALIFGKDDIMVKHYERREDVEEGVTESVTEPDMVRFKTSMGSIVDWTEDVVPEYGVVDLRIEKQGRELRCKTFYMSAVNADAPIVRDYEKSQIVYVRIEDGKTIETTVQDEIGEGEEPLEPTRRINVGTKDGYAEVEVYRPTLRREMCIDGRVVETIDDEDIVVPYRFKDEITVNCFTREGYQSYDCKHLSSIYDLLDDASNAHLGAWVEGRKYEAKELDRYAPGCLKVWFGSPESDSDDADFYRWDYRESEEPEPCNCDDEVGQNGIIFQSLSGKNRLKCLCPQRKTHPFKYKKEQVSYVKCFDVAMEHNLYFFELWPFTKINDFKEEFYDKLVDARGGELSEKDKIGLARFAEEFKFNWKDYKVEL